MKRWVIGAHACREAMRVRPQAIQRALVRTDWKESKGWLAELAGSFKKHRIRIEAVSTRDLDRMGEGHQGLALELSESPELDWSQVGRGSQEVLLALDGISDPHNLGAITRTAWLLGAQGILIPKARSAPLTAVACKVASGGAEHIPVDVHSTLASPLNTLKDKGFWVFGLSEKGTKSLWELKIPEKLVWIVGAEDTGLRSQSEGFCDELIRVPQTSDDASLNAGVAAALALAETARQWQLSMASK